MENDTAVEKVVIIGGGPAGLAAAVYNGRAFLKPLVIEGAPSGGQLMLTTDVENYPAFDSIQGPELIARMRAHAAKFEARFLAENVEKVDTTSKPFSIHMTSGKIIKTESILIATGASAKWLNIESEQRLRGRGVTACATCDGFFFKNKVVAVVGGGDTAMEEALTLTNFATKVYLIHRRDQFRASQIMQERVKKHPKIEIIFNAEIEEVLGKERVEGLKLKKTTDDSVAPETVELQGLFLAIGHTPNTEFLKGSGVALNEKDYIVTSGLVAWEKFRKEVSVDENLQFDYHFQYVTTVPGIFAAGDCVDYIYRQAATAVGAGVAASLEIERYLMDVLDVI